MNAFHVACNCGHLDIVRYMIENSKDFELSTINSTGQNALHSACQEGHLNVVKLLLENAKEKGISVLTIDNDGNTILHAVVSQFYFNITDATLEMIQLILIFESNIDTRQTNNDGETPLDIVQDNVDQCLEDWVLPGLESRLEKWRDVKWCLENSEEFMFQQKYGESVFHTYCRNGDLEVVKMLLDQPKYVAYVNEEDSDGKTPLHHACHQSQSVEMVQLFLDNAREKEINVLAMDFEENTILHEAVLQCKATEVTLEIVKLILTNAKDSRLDPNQTNIWNKTALDIAKEKLNILKEIQHDEEDSKWKDIEACLESIQ